ncbi:MAG: peptidylprolyl isomerase [Endozoicomonadaceae bacterium]|nr:peptidylprolyl isomerase [Endozoicomonadaceae bacterium]
MKEINKQWLSTLLPTIMIALTLSGAPLRAEVVPLDRIAAIVNNDIIMESTLLTRLKAVKLHLKERKTALPQEHILKHQILERLIIENLQLQIANRTGIRVDDWALNEAISAIAKRNNMTNEQFQKALEADGLSYREARNEIHREMLISRVRQRQVRERIQITDRNIDNYLNSEEGTHQLAAEYHLGHILIALPEGPSPSEIQTAKQAANAIVQQLKKGEDFYKVAIAHSQGQKALEGGDLGWRKAHQLPSLFAKAANHLQLGDITQPIRSPSGFHIIKLLDKRGYDNLLQEQFNVRHILIRPNEVRNDSDAKKLATNLYKRLKNGSDFAELARTYSDDTGTALSGGHLQWVNPNDMAPPFRDQMTSISENTISTPFQSSFGWHILEVFGKRKEDISNSVQRTRIREILSNQKYEDELQAWLRELRDQAHVEIKL